MLTTYRNAYIFVANIQKYDSLEDRIFLTGQNQKFGHSRPE